MKEYNPKENSRYLQYLDANNLYEWAMPQPLPTRGFRWVDVDPGDVKELSTREDRGYLMEVDMLYPKDLNNDHNELPFMCRGMKVGNIENWLQIYITRRSMLSTLELYSKLWITD